MSAWPVGIIPYANLGPLRVSPPPGGCRLVPLVPRRATEALEDGDVLAAPVPVGDLPSLAGLVRPVGLHGIAARGAVQSVLLASDRPLEDLAAPARLRLSEDSSSSVRLIYLLLGEALGFDRLPLRAAPGGTAEGELLIGDAALLEFHRPRWSHHVDLAERWRESRGLSFVFARWVARVDAPAGLEVALRAWLDAFAAREAACAEAAAPIEAARLGLDTEALRSYFHHLRWGLDAGDVAGQDRFLADLARHGRTPLFRPAPAPSPARPARLSADEALDLWRRAPLGELMAAGHEARLKRHPAGEVSFVLDTNPNYTNVCETRCLFCAFCRPAGHPEAYTLTPDALAGRVRLAAAGGATTVLLQGGHNPALRLADWLAYLRAIRAAAPAVHLHPFSPPEIAWMARREGLTIRAVLEALRAEGVTTMPGGGAEILSGRVRLELSPGKATAREWLEVMEIAHGLGMRTTATMMYGHLETDAEIVGHLQALRDLQDRTGGFSSFVPWSFKPGGSPLSSQVPASAHPARYARIIALARIFLDNFAHVQSSWFSESPRAGQLALLAGADDFGGLLVEEHVLRQAGHAPAATLPEVLALIRAAGFRPVRRDSSYAVVERYDRG